MKNLQEKIDNWKKENNFDYSNESESAFFEWLEADEYPEINHIDYNGLSGTYPTKKWYTAVFEDGNEVDFYL